MFKSLNCFLPKYFGKKNFKSKFLNSCEKRPDLAYLSQFGFGFILLSKQIVKKFLSIEKKPAYLSHSKMFKF